MSSEFDGSFKHEISELSAEEHRMLQAFAEETDDLEILQRLHEAAVMIAFVDEYNTEADDVAVFIKMKIEDIEERALQASKAWVEKWAEQDKERERRFLSIFMHVYQKPSQQQIEEEAKREALFKPSDQ